MPTARRTVITILLVATATTSLAFATGAAVLDGPADTFADDDRIVVQPAEGPGGNYTHMNDGEIAIDISASNPNLPNDFEGINPDTLASAEGVFRITYTASESADVWIDHTGENVTFVADGESIEGKTNNVTLGPNESVAVGLRIDARGEAAGTTLGDDEFSINASIVDPEDVSTGSTSSNSGISVSSNDDDDDDDRPSTTNDESVDNDTSTPEPTATPDESDDGTPGDSDDVQEQEEDEEGEAEPQPDAESEPGAVNAPSGDAPEPEADTDSTDDDQILETGAIDLGDIGGLALLLGLASALVVLVRRMPRS